MPSVRNVCDDTNKKGFVEGTIEILKAVAKQKMYVVPAWLLTFLKPPAISCRYKINVKLIWVETVSSKVLMLEMLQHT